MTSNILPLDLRMVRPIIERCLQEDAPTGDLTANALIAPGTTMNATVTARQPGVVSGTEVFREVMHFIDPSVKIELELGDGEPFSPGTALLHISGPAHPILLGERLGLNLLQRMSGIATTTAAYVAAAGGALSYRGVPVRIADTRKTTPGLRLLERYAVRCGGGFNHRDTLSDAVMAKDNHLALLGAGEELTAKLVEARAKLGHTTHFEVEIDSLDQLEAVLAAEVDTIMLDNFSVADLAEGVARIAGRAYVEASGGITLESIRDIAATGVDVISSGALTHSVKALDLGLDASYGPA